MTVSRSIVRYLALVVTVLGLVAGITSCDTEAGAYYGPPEKLGNGTARTYVKLDPYGHPTEVGVRLSASAMDGLPQQDPVPPLILNFPVQASPTVFNHVMLNWNPHGHDPIPLFGKPHFDFHFYMVPVSLVDSITPSGPNFATHAANLPSPRYMPQDYVPAPGSPVQETAPDMGLHWFDSTQKLIPGQYDFKQILLNGSWDGQYIFMEPMITRNFLMAKGSVHEAVKQPTMFQINGFYPTTYSCGYDSSTNEYVVTLGDLKMVHAS